MSALTWIPGTVDTGGVTIAYDITSPPAGRGNGETVLLIMGLSTQSIFWPDEFVGDLVGRGFRVVRFDNRDVGLSGSVDRGVATRITPGFLKSRLGLKVTSNYTLSDMVDDTVGLLDHLAIAAAHVVGISMGGIIGQMLAAEHPARVRSLSLIMSHTNHPVWGIPHVKVLLAMTPPPRVITRERFVAAQVRLFQTLASPLYRRTDDELAVAFGAAFDRDPRTAGMERQTHALFASPCIDDLLPKITAPTTVLHGLADLLVLPRNSRRIAARIKGATLTLFDGMGHDFPRALLPKWVELIADNARRAG